MIKRYKMLEEVALFLAEASSVRSWGPCRSPSKLQAQLDCCRVGLVCVHAVDRTPRMKDACASCELRRWPSWCIHTTHLCVQCTSYLLYIILYTKRFFYLIHCTSEGRVWPKEGQPPFVAISDHFLPALQHLQVRGRVCEAGDAGSKAQRMRMHLYTNGNILYGHVKNMYVYYIIIIIYNYYYVPFWVI